METSGQSPTEQEDLTHQYDISRKRKAECPGDILFTQGKYSNLKIVVGEKEFKVHEELLTSNSEYFARSLSSTWNQNKRIKTSEGEMTVLHLEIEDTEAFEILLRLLYYSSTSQQLRTVSRALRVVRLCHEFLFEELEERCIQFIKKTMKLEDISEVSEVAARWEIDNLRKHTESILQTTDYNMLPPDQLIKVIESATLGNQSARCIARMEMQCNSQLNSSVNKQVLSSILKDQLFFSGTVWNPRHYRGIEEFLWELIKDFMPHDDIVKHMCLNLQLMESLKAARLDASRTLSSVLFDTFQFLADGVAEGRIRPEMLLAFSKWGIFVFQKPASAVKKLVYGLSQSQKIGKTSGDVFLKVVHVLMKIMRSSDLKEHDEALVTLLQNSDASVGIQVCKLLMQVESNDGMVKLGDNTTKEIMHFQQALLQAKLENKRSQVSPPSTPLSSVNM